MKKQTYNIEQQSLFTPPSFSAIVKMQNDREDPPHRPHREKLQKLLHVMQSGNWYSPFELSEFSGIPILSITQRIRDLRSAKFGGHTVVNEQDEKGTRYRLIS